MVPHENTTMAAEAAEAADHWLDDIWTWYFHDPSNTSWTLESYKRLCDISTIEEFWQLNDAHAPLVPNGMFFLMRESVFPCWDDPTNIKGGCASMKVSVSEVQPLWEMLCKRMLGETLVVKEDDDRVINGISISPKRSFCILKIWMSDDRFGGGEDMRRHLRIPSTYTGDIIYRKNTENIQNDAIKPKR